MVLGLGLGLMRKREGDLTRFRLLLAPISARFLRNFQRQSR